MDRTIGTAQTNIAVVTIASASLQRYYVTRFVSEPLSGISSISAQTWTYNFASSENSSSANFPVDGTAKPVRITCYVWRPSTTSKVGDILDGNSASTVNESTAPSEYSHNVSFTGSAVAGVADADVICFEVWFEITQPIAVAHTGQFYYDGTTVTTTEATVVSSHASFLETPQDLTFEGGLIRVALSQTYRYNIIQRISQSRIYRYAIRTRVTLPQTYKYNITGRVSLARTYRYVIQGQTTGDVGAHFRSLAAMHGVPVVLQPTAIERSLQESFSIGDSLEREKVVFRELEETVSITDLPPPEIVKTHTCVTEDSFNIFDITMERVVTKFKTLAEGFTIGEARTIAVFISKALAQSFTISDARSMARTRGRSLAQSFTVSEALQKSMQKFRSFLSVESFSITDLVVAGKAKAKALAEAFTIDDTMLGTIVAKKFRDIADAFTVTEAPTRVSTKNRAPGFPETFTIGEALTRLKARGKLVTETFSIGEALTRSLAKTRSIAQSFTISELLARSKSRALALAQSFTITDAVARLKVRGKLLSETFTTAETLARVKYSFRSFAQSFTITDALAKTQIKTRSIAQSFTITELLSRVKSRALQLAQSFAITDAVSRVTGIALFLSESFTITTQPTLGRFKDLFIAGQFLISDLVNAVRQLAGAPQWILTGQASDFPNSLEYLLKSYINANWSIHEPAIGASRARDIQVDNFAYDAFRTYYLKLKETGSTVTTRQIRYNTYEFETPIEIECYSRRLSKGEAYRELNNIINELLRIFGTYPHELMFGIQGVLFERISQIERVVSAGNAAPGVSSASTIWVRRLTITLHYYKVSIAG